MPSSLFHQTSNMNAQKRGEKKKLFVWLCVYEYVYLWRMWVRNGKRCARGRTHARTHKLSIATFSANIECTKKRERETNGGWENVRVNEWERMAAINFESRDFGIVLIISVIFVDGCKLCDFPNAAVIASAVVTTTASACCCQTELNGTEPH